MQNPTREIDVMESIRERIETVGIDGLTEPELYYWAIWWLEGEANNGSLDQYFRNSSGTYADAALRALTAVGAQQMAAVFQAAMGLFPNGKVPTDRDQRYEIMNAFTREQEEELDKLSDAFTDYPDDLGSLVDNYVQENEPQFLGPRTLMEQWTARRARGAETQPHGISEWDLDEEARKDAQSTDRKCPICSQPAPHYRKTCKRCGYPYGRAVGRQG